MTNFHRVFRSTVFRSLLVLSLAFTPFSLFAATPLDINAATADQFAAVMSGIGIKKAEAIVAYREANGRFNSISQLTEVKGVGPKIVDRNQTVIRVQGAEGKAN